MTAVARPQALRAAALRAQELVVTARAIEARVSSLTPQTPEPIIEETVALVRATALQLAATLHDLIAASVSMTSGTTSVPDGSPLNYCTQP
jgi:hypothetical protein